MLAACRGWGPNRMNTSIKNRTIAAVFAAIAACAAAGTALTAPKPPEPVKIDGYDDTAMEPFVSRDGRFLFFNTSNAPGANTNIHFAESDGTGGFKYRGVLYGTISFDLDAVPAMADDGRFCFVSPREYRRTRVSVWCGTFDGKKVNNAAPQAPLASERLGRLIFDVDLSADGRTMIFAEGTFSGAAVPDEADLYMAELTAEGFKRVRGSERLFAKLNTGSLEYAPALSADGLELYFTRPSGIWPFGGKAKIYRAVRKSTDEAFGEPVELPLDGFVEGASLAPDGTLYFHKRVGDGYQIWRQAR
jgi:hypothetical protein